jgi:uncharacterized protein (DUF433 family)
VGRATHKAEPFSIRLRAEDDRFVKEEARRLNRSPGAIVEGYASEWIRMQRYPGIAFRGEDYRRRAWVLGTGLDVWEIVALRRDFDSELDFARAYALTPAQITIAQAYHRAFPEEIDDLIARGRRSEEELRGAYPFIQTFEEAATSGAQ